MTRYIAFQLAVPHRLASAGGGRPSRLLRQLAARSGILPALRLLTDYQLLAKSRPALL